MTIIITDKKKQAILQDIYPQWHVIPALEQAYLIKDLRTELLPSNFVDYVITTGPEFSLKAELAKYLKSERNPIDGVIIVSDPDSSYDTHTLAIQSYLHQENVPSRHVPTFCLDKNWLREEVWAKNREMTSIGSIPPIISQAEATTFNAQINFISAKELKKEFSKIASTLPEQIQKLPAALLTRAAFLAIQITREIQRETSQKYYEMVLGENNTPEDAKKNLYYLSRIDHIVVKNQSSEIQKAWMADSQRWENPEKRDFLENHFTLKEPVNKIVRFPTLQEVLQLQWELQIQNNFVVINVVVEDDIQENCNPINLKTLAREHLYNSESKLSPLEDMMVELFYLYNSGFITWPKSGGYHTPPHLIQDFKNAYRENLQFLKSGRIPQNRNNYENPNNWAICPTNAILDTQAKIRKAILDRKDVPSNVNLEKVVELYYYIRTRFLQSILGNKHTDRRISYLAGPVDKNGKLISPDKTYFFRKINNPKEAIPEIGQILQFPPRYRVVYNDPLPASTAAVSYLLSNLLQPGTTKRKIHELIKNEVLVTRKKAMENHKKNIESWHTGGRIGTAPKNNFPPDQYQKEPSELTPSIEPAWEHIMKIMERRMPSLVFPHKIQELQNQILNIAAGSASADQAYRNWLNTLKQEKNQVIIPEYFYQKQDIRKFNT